MEVEMEVEVEVKAETKAVEGGRLLRHRTKQKWHRVFAFRCQGSGSGSGGRTESGNSGNLSELRVLGAGRGPIAPIGRSRTVRPMRFLLVTLGMVTNHSTPFHEEIFLFFSKNVIEKSSDSTEK